MRPSIAHSPYSSVTWPDSFVPDWLIVMLTPTWPRGVTNSTRHRPATLGCCFCSASGGGGLAGKWDVTFVTPGGEFPANATFTEEGGKISGTFGSQMGEAPITGTVDGHTFKLTMTAQTPQGSMDVALTGEVDGDAIKGKAEIAGMGQMEWSAKRAKP